MMTFSLCMIVKNEEAVLARCLDSIQDLMDEIIIVDTGSTDRTKEIAAQYTDKIYDFAWVDDFSAARNFAFSKATCDYIYSADADEVLDIENHQRLAMLKQYLLPEIEIVQMHYLTRNEYNTTQNYMDEYRPKLYKRLRTFTWIHPVHEVVRLDPVVFDSDIEIIHLPQSMHNKRDFHIFKNTFEQQGALSPEVFSMYAKELFISGADWDFTEALTIAKSACDDPATPEKMLQEAQCILAHAYLAENKIPEFFDLAFRTLHDFPCSEICFEIGEYFRLRGDCEEAGNWYKMAIEETEPVIDIRRGGTLAEERLRELHKTH